MTENLTTIVGIDLGTTNSSIAVMDNGTPRLILVDGQPLLPSVVGVGADGSILVGQAARNQQLLYPERTISSIKRRMGESARVRLLDQEYSPEEISAMILRRLKSAGENHLGTELKRAVITVPAYFSDAQRSATKEAGEIAGFEVDRIINEPTAASLCYVDEQKRDHTFMVYDLGGGTFDVSIVRTSGEITEVLSSHGDTRLGGDDMDLLLMDHLRRRFEESHKLSLENDKRALARLCRAAEKAKIELSTESYVRISEEYLANIDGVGVHLDDELSRFDYQNLIESLIEKTKDSVQTALREADILSEDIDELILVGGATRTPLVSEMLFELTGKMPLTVINPDQAVALGAALQAARIAGQKPGRILVDVSPFSFGTSYFGLLNGLPSIYCYKPIIKRNCPLPNRQTEVFVTMQDGQRAIDVEVFQGESEDARNNIPIGQFMVDGLSRAASAGSPILFDLKLNLNGILEVEVTEKKTGLKKGITIENAFKKLSDSEIEQARQRLMALRWQDEEPGEVDDPEAERKHPVSNPGSDRESISDIDTSYDDSQDLLPDPPEDIPSDRHAAWTKAVSLIEKASRMSAGLPENDRNEVATVVDNLRACMVQGDFEALDSLSDELGDILFYLE